MKIAESLKAYKFNIARAIAGFVFKKNDKDLSEEEIKRGAQIGNDLQMEDYLDISFALDDDNIEQIAEILNKVGVKQEAAPQPDQVDKPEPTDQKQKESKMLKQKQKKVQESVLGMSNVPGLNLNRMRQLAGLPLVEAPLAPIGMPNSDETVMDMPEDDAYDTSAYDSTMDADGNYGDDYDSEYDTGLGDEMGHAMDVGMGDMGMDEPVDPEMDEMDIDDPMDSEMDDSMGYDDDMGYDDLDDDMDAGLPDPMGMADDAMMPEEQDIHSLLDQIEQMLPQVPVGEFKSVIDKLKGVLATARTTGADALQESERLKKRIR